MGAPISEADYTSATTRRGDLEVYVYVTFGGVGKEKYMHLNFC
jgi:hypothetical protein